MRVVSSLKDLNLERENLPKPIGLVPTMGFLHEGHLSLVRESVKQCASTVVSIFINPTQFGPKEDLAKYPRDLKRDLSLLENAGADVVWCPEEAIMYPPGFQTWINVEEVTNKLEGAMRPGHFRGVATIVGKLFNAVLPQKAYFGQKDAQQVVVIRRMVKDLNFQVEIIVCPIVRETDGLALSSRNIYLSTEERKAALVLSKALKTAGAAYNNGDHDAENLRRIMLKVFNTEPLAKVQYISCADPDTLDELIHVDSCALLSVAVYIGSTRLIDNLSLPCSDDRVEKAA
jgi:pantoate--beta-alanine ligase